MTQPDQFPATSRQAVRGIDRRTVITAGGVAVGVVGAASVAACGEDGGTADLTDAGSTSPGTIRAADIPVGGGKVYDAAGVVVTQPMAGEFKAFSATCTHESCTVADVDNGTINCRCHGSRFDLATGQVTAGPASSPLPGRTVTVTGDSITIA